jgi:hypothetical protein
MDVIDAAPVFPVDPAMTSKWPVLPLWASADLGIKCDRISWAVIRKCLGPTAAAI